MTSIDVPVVAQDDARIRIADVPTTFLETRYLSFGINSAFQRDLDRQFRLFLDDQAVQNDELFLSVDPYCYKRVETQGYTTSPLGQIVRAPTITWRQTDRPAGLPRRFATISVDAEEHDLSLIASRASLQCLPYVSPYAVYHVDNVDDGESGRHRTDNMRAGDNYGRKVENDIVVHRLLRGRFRSVHSNLFVALAAGLNWNNDQRVHLMRDFRMSLNHMIRHMTYKPEEGEWAKYISDDGLSLFFTIYECENSEDSDFIGDVHLAQAFGRWLKVIYGIELCIITPLGSACTNSFISVTTVVLAWEPASRSWNVWSREGPVMDDNMCHEAMTVCGWEFYTRDILICGHVSNDEDFYTWLRRVRSIPSIRHTLWRNVFVSEASDRWIRHVETHFTSMGGNYLPRVVDSSWCNTAQDLLFEGNV